MGECCGKFVGGHTDNSKCDLVKADAKIKSLESRLRRAEAVVEAAREVLQVLGLREQYQERERIMLHDALNDYDLGGGE